MKRKENQNRMCGKGVGNELKYWKTNVLYSHIAIFELILAMFLIFQSCDFDVIEHIGP